MSEPFTKYLKRNMNACKMKKHILFFTILILLFSLFPVTVYANSPPPPSYFYVEVANPPENAVFVDILIEIDAQSDGYTAFNTENGRRHGITAESEIAEYNQDGYMSLAYHYDGVWAESQLGYVSLFEMYPSTLSLDKITKTLKIALLDREGNIIQTSRPIDITPPGKQFARTLIYDANEALTEIGFEVFYRSSIFFLFSFFGVIIGRMLLSVGVETLIAIPFAIRPLRKIILVNCITQIALITFMSFSGLTYITALIIGEIFVYLSECAAYMMMFKSVTKTKIIVYTAVANTATLIMGLLMNSFHIFVY